MSVSPSWKMPILRSAFVNKYGKIRFSEDWKSFAQLQVRKMLEETPVCYKNQPIKPHSTAKRTAVFNH